MIANHIGWLGVSFEIQPNEAVRPNSGEKSAPWYSGVRPSKLPIVDSSILPHAELRSNDLWEDAPHFTTGFTLDSII